MIKNMCVCECVSNSESMMPALTFGNNWNLENIKQMEERGQVICCENNRKYIFTKSCLLFFFFFWPRRAACGILVPRPGIEPMPPALRAWSLNHWTASEVPSQLFFFFNKFIYFIHIFLAALGPRCWAQAFSSCGERGLLFFVVHGLLIAVASLVAEHRLQAHGLQQLWHAGSVVVARRLQNAGSVAVAHGLSCSAACGIFLDQGSNPCPLHWQADS